FLHKLLSDPVAGNLLTLGGIVAKNVYKGSVGVQLGATVQGFLGSLATYEDGFAAGFSAGINWLVANLPKYPEVLPFVSTPLGLPQPVLNPGATPGVQIGNITTDSIFTMPVAGNQLPLVFDLPITNTGPATDTFRIQTTGTGYFSPYTSVGLLTLKGGE